MTQEIENLFGGSYSQITDILQHSKGHGTASSTTPEGGETRRVSILVHTAYPPGWINTDANLSRNTSLFLAPWIYNHDGTTPLFNFLNGTQTGGVISGSAPLCRPRSSAIFGKQTDGNNHGTILHTIGCDGMLDIPVQHELVRDFGSSFDCIAIRRERILGGEDWSDSGKNEIGEGAAYGKGADIEPVAVAAKDQEINVEFPDVFGGNNAETLPVHGMRQEEVGEYGRQFHLFISSLSSVGCGRSGRGRWENVHVEIEYSPPRVGGGRAHEFRSNAAEDVRSGSWEEQSRGSVR